MKLEEAKIICPYCKKEISYLKKSVINISEDNILKSDVLNLKMFKINCTCAKSFNVYYPFLYIDKEKGFKISYEYENIEEDNLVLRMVDKPYLIIEKILIFEANFNDKIMEIYKEFLLASLGELGELLFSIDKDKNYKLILLEKGTFKRIIDFKVELYNNIYNKFYKYIINDNQNKIDKKWAQNFLMEVKLDE